MTSKYKYACWYLVNGFKCKHQENCNFSHDPYTIYEYRTNLKLDICTHGYDCPIKCNKIHSKKDLFYECYNETRKRKRAEKDIEEGAAEAVCCREEIKKLKFEITNLKSETKENVCCTKLEYALGQTKREMKAIKEVHREVLNKEYLDDNYKHLQKNQQEFTQLFNKFRLDFYNMKDDDADSAIRLVEQYICDVNNAIQFRSKKLHS